MISHKPSRNRLISVHSSISLRTVSHESPSGGQCFSVLSHRFIQAVTFYDSGSKTFWKRERLIDRHTSSVVLRILMSVKRFAGNSCGTSYQHRTYP